MVRSLADRTFQLRSKKKMGPDAIVTEMLIQTAYHNNTVGIPLMAGPGATTKFAPETLRDYMLAHFAPERMVRFSPARTERNECLGMARHRPSQHLQETLRANFFEAAAAQRHSRYCR